MAYQANPAGIGVGKRYGRRSINTVDGTLSSKGGKLYVKLHADANDLTGPNYVMVPPFCVVEAYDVAVKSAVTANTVLTVKMAAKASDGTFGTANDLSTTPGTTDKLTSGAVGQTNIGLTATAANLQTGQYGAKVTIAPTGMTGGRLEVMLTLKRI